MPKAGVAAVEPRPRFTKPVVLNTPLPEMDSVPPAPLVASLVFPMARIVAAVPPRPKVPPLMPT